MKISISIIFLFAFLFTATNQGLAQSKSFKELFEKLENSDNLKLKQTIPITGIDKSENAFGKALIGKSKQKALLGNDPQKNPAVSLQTEPLIQGELSKALANGLKNMWKK